jgi:hypothetical protein
LKCHVAVFAMLKPLVNIVTACLFNSPVGCRHSSPGTLHFALRRVVSLRTRNSLPRYRRTLSTVAFQKLRPSSLDPRQRHSADCVRFCGACYRHIRQCSQYRHIVSVKKKKNSLPNLPNKTALNYLNKNELPRILYLNLYLGKIFIFNGILRVTPFRLQSESMYMYKY